MLPNNALCAVLLDSVSDRVNRGRLQSCIAAARRSGIVELRIRVQKRRWTLPHAVCVRLAIGEKCGL